MPRERPQRATVLNTAVHEIGREISARTVMFHQAIAERVGLNTTDHRALDILSRAGPVTAGELAELTGLTTGAITGIIDRLEKAGFVRRDSDPKDRRRVIIQPILEKIERDINPFFASFVRAMNELRLRYTDQELSIIRDYMARCSTILQEETAKLRRQAPQAKEAVQQ